MQNTIPPIIYQLTPASAGTISGKGGWIERLPAIAALGFNCLAVGPLHTNALPSNPFSLTKRLLGSGDRDGKSALMGLLAATTAQQLGLMITIDLSLEAANANERQRSRISDYLLAMADIGVSGVLLRTGHHFNGATWREILTPVKGRLQVVAECFGATASELEALRGSGFDYILNSSCWWDFRSRWLLEEHERLCAIAPTLAVVAGMGAPAVSSHEEALLRYSFAALSAGGLVMPAGFEQEPVAPAAGEPGRVEVISALNRLLVSSPSLASDGRQHLLTLPERGVTALACHAGEDGVWVLLINPSVEQPQQVDLQRLWRLVGGTLETYSEVTLPEGVAVTRSQGTLTLSSLGIALLHGDYRHARDHLDEIAPLVSGWGAIDSVLGADYEDPFAVRGMHPTPSGKGLLVRTFQAGADRVEVIESASGETVAELEQLHPAGFFAGRIGRRNKPFGYRLRVWWHGQATELEDPYRFGPVLGELDIHLLAEGRHLRAYERLGAHPLVMEGVAGVAFAVWAPNARRVAVVGDFNTWDGRRHPMRLRHDCGVWELFIPGIGEGEHYKYEIKGADGQLLPQKADPFGFAAEHPPRTASIVHAIQRGEPNDGEWLAGREARHAVSAPISIYEVHLGSWRRMTEEGNRYLSYRELAEQLIPYVVDMGFTHIELMPVSEFPFDGSWGYQPIGLFAPTSRFGSPADFIYFMERCHQAGIGVLIDWVPGHFPTDPHGLGHFDGSQLYEHADPRQGFHQDWNTLIYNYGRQEVRNFLQSNALFWFDRYHIDGLRVDAVASMLYLNYSRKEGEWIPNEFGGNENLAAIDFLRRTNEQVYADFPGAMTAAEESTSWPGVSRPTYTGGLGFGYKWNMGWMHDTLNYMSREPIHRRHHHHEMTFGLLYAFAENFILPLSHDEVVHGKGSLLDKMPGDAWQKFANLRAYYGFMWGHPGKKLLFMGCEFAQGREWDHNNSLDWHLLDIDLHAGMQRLVKDLNWLYRHEPALHQNDCHGDGFEWVKANSADESVYAFIRRGEAGSRPALIVCNFTPVVRHDYRVGVPEPGVYRERINTDAAIYGGSNCGNGGVLNAEIEGWDGQSHSLRLTVPPLSTVILIKE